MELKIIIILIIFILINILIKYFNISLNSVKEQFVSNSKKLPNEIYLDNLGNSDNYEKLDVDIVEELFNKYNIYNSENLKEFNKNSKKYNLAEDYPKLF